MARRLLTCQAFIFGNTGAALFRQHNQRDNFLACAVRRGIRGTVPVAFTRIVSCAEESEEFGCRFALFM
jgi:hypothetical protein